jgi:predicted DNA-binding transcriptional regulator YafY
MNRIDRLFNILTLLQSKKYVPAEKIAEKFGLSIRTVYRDIKALTESGIPISFEPQRGYFVVPGYFLPPVTFTSEEANALVLMEAIVSGFADPVVYQHYTNALTKVKTVLRATQQEKLEQLASRIRLQVPECFTLKESYLSILQNAIANKIIVEIAYENNRKEASKRKIEPIGLIFYAMAWHLIAWCHKRNAYRDFKVARIQRLQLTDYPFLRQKHVSIDQFMQELPVAY